MGKPWENHGKTIGKAQNEWFVVENPSFKWMIAGGIPMTWETTICSLEHSYLPCHFADSKSRDRVI